MIGLLKPLVLDLYREYREHVKDLSCITKDFGRIVIVDNNPFSFLLQPVNGIPCIPFSAGQPHDTQVTKSNHWNLLPHHTYITHCSGLNLFFFCFVNQLLDVLLPLLKQLSDQKDVRPALYERFHMPEWFQKQGIPAPGWTL